jgi:Predicted alternative thymidylate synthase
MKHVAMEVKGLGIPVEEQGMLRLVGEIAGECYNSSMDMDKCIQRALNCIKRGHHSPWEHVTVTLKCTVDRGVSHALVRHRHCAFQQSSTIYQKFDELVFIKPNNLSGELARQIEQEYKWHVDEGMKPSEARDVLPNCLATNLIITTNIRQWMYMIQRRCGPGDSDNMHEWCAKTRAWFEEHYPQVTAAFDAWYQEHPL